MGSLENTDKILILQLHISIVTIITGILNPVLSYNLPVLYKPVFTAH